MVFSGFSYVLQCYFDSLRIAYAKKGRASADFLSKFFAFFRGYFALIFHHQVSRSLLSDSQRVNFAKKSAKMLWICKKPRLFWWISIFCTIFLMIFFEKKSRLCENSAPTFLKNIRPFFNKPLISFEKAWPGWFFPF